MIRLSRAVVACLLACGTLAAAPMGVGASEGLVVTSRSVYEVAPADGIIAVTVDVTATNVTPDTATERIYYTGFSMPIPVGATSVTATAGGAVLPVSLQPADEIAQLAEVTFGTGVFYQQTYRFTLSFVIEDAGGDPERETWVRQSFVAFPVWSTGSGTADGTSVEVILPPGYVASVPHGEMEIVSSPTETRLIATSIADPSSFFAYVSAERAGNRVRDRLDVPFATGTRTVLLLAWPDDPDWTQRQGDILLRGLPALEAEIGLSYPIGGVLRVSEHAYQHLGGYAGFFVEGDDSIQIRFDADPFTTLHESAHIWFNSRLSSDRWLLEGFASYYAELVGTELGEPLDMHELSDEVRGAAFPLEAWGEVGDESLEREDYGYAASHELARRIAVLAGADGLRGVWAAADALRPAYAEAPDERRLRGDPRVPDWQRFLDLFENETGADFDALWLEWVLSEDHAPLLADRESARASYDTTTAAADGWSLPRSTRMLMEGWEFDEARAELRATDAFFAGRDALDRRATRLVLVPTASLRAAFEADGVDAAVAELAEQEASLDAIEAAMDRLERAFAPVERIGLLGEREPTLALDAAQEAYEAGDDETARHEALAASAAADGAADRGRVRVALAGGGVLLADLLAMFGLAASRRRAAARGAALG